MSAIVEFATGILDLGLDLPGFTPTGKRHRDLLKAGDTFERGLAIERDYLSKRDAPTPCPEIGDVYLVGPNPSGVFVGHAGEIAEWTGVAWVFASVVVDLTGWTVLDAEICDDTGAVVDSFSTSPTPLDTTGTITLRLSPAQTAALGDAIYNYAIRITDGVDVKSIVCGRILFTTKAATP